MSVLGASTENVPLLPLLWVIGAPSLGNTGAVEGL